MGDRAPDGFVESCASMVETYKPRESPRTR